MGGEGEDPNLAVHRLRQGALQKGHNCEDKPAFWLLFTLHYEVTHAANVKAASVLDNSGFMAVNGRFWPLWAKKPSKTADMGTKLNNISNFFRGLDLD